MTEVISVRFKNKGKSYYFDPNGINAEKGQSVIVETSKGLEFAECVRGNHEVSDDDLVLPLRPVIRIATEEDIAHNKENKIKEAEALAICQEKIKKHGLDMKLVDVEYNFESTKILFFFTSDGRVDFRDLVKDLASVFKTRIELRQIGVRDEARMLGGLGICGRPFCCAQFLDDFQPVSIKMAKTQGLSLNPTKISGTCGRLMCCLKYEQDAYEDLVKDAPKVDSFVETPAGKGSVVDINLLRRKARVHMEDPSDTAIKNFDFDELEVLGGKAKRAEYLSEQARLREEGIIPEKPQPKKPEPRLDVTSELAKPKAEKPSESRQPKPEKKKGDQRPKPERKPKPPVEPTTGEEQPKAENKQQRKPRPDQNRQGQNKPKGEGKPRQESKPKAEQTGEQVERTEQKPKQNHKPRNNNQRKPRPDGENKPQGQPKHGEQKPQAQKSQGQKPQGQKPQGQRPQGQKPQGQKPQGQKPQGQRPPKPRNEQPKTDAPKNNSPKPEQTGEQKKPQQGGKGKGGHNNYHRRPHKPKPKSGEGGSAPKSEN